MFRSEGILKYSRGANYGYRLVAEVDKELVRFYRSLIPKWIYSQPQMYHPHISTVRKEVPTNTELWGKHENKIISFTYCPEIHFSPLYVWLNCWSSDLEAIRVELGLPIDSKYTRPPDGFERTFHITIGNFKHETGVSTDC